MKVATWNVNSIKARKERLLAWLGRNQPDVLCLQELKVDDGFFPREELEQAGYFAAVHGQKTYNGVAILGRTPPENVRVGLGDGVEDPQARLLRASFGKIEVLSAYVPNGATVVSDKFTYKQQWLARLRALLERDHDPAREVVLCGDLNIAPDDRDVARPEEWSGSVLCAPEVRSAFAGLVAWGLVDCVRKHYPDGGVYSWWDYQQLAFPKGNGLRIDHILATRALSDRCPRASVDRNERKGKLPSDHAPVIVEFD